MYQNIKLCGVLKKYCSLTQDPVPPPIPSYRLSPVSRDEGKDNEEGVGIGDDVLMTHENGMRRRPMRRIFMSETVGVLAGGGGADVGLPTDG